MRNKKSESGIMLPMVLMLMTASLILLGAMLTVVISMSGFSREIVYRQVSLSAAKSALDYGKERFDASANFDQIDSDGDGNIDNDSNSNGIADPLEETELFTNSVYRVTFQLNVLGTTATAKKVSGIGRVYLPASSTTPRYTRQLTTAYLLSPISIISAPSAFGPLAWYDASCNPSASASLNSGITETDCEIPHLFGTNSVSASANPTSLREEKSSGEHCGGAPLVGDGYFSLTRQATDNCSGNVRTGGLVFNFGNSLPKGSVIADAYLQFQAGAVGTEPNSVRIRGIDHDNTPDLTANVDELRTAPTTSAQKVWPIPPWSTPGESSTNQRATGLQSIIQEIIDRPGWNTGNNIGIHIENQAGNKTRHASYTVTLNLVFEGSDEAQQNNPISVWRDRSGNGFDLLPIDSSSRPSWQIWDGYKPMVSFAASASAMTASVPASSGRNSDAITTIAVMLPGSGTSTNGSGVITGIYGNGTSNKLYAQFWRHWTSGIGSNYLCTAQTQGSNIQPHSCQDAFGNAAWKVSSNRVVSPQADQFYRLNGYEATGPVLQNAGNIKLDAPYDIYLGYDPLTSVRGAEFDLAELVIYDRELTCSQIESVENYLVQKWSINNYQSDGCSDEYVAPVF